MRVLYVEPTLSCQGGLSQEGLIGDDAKVLTAEEKKALGTCLSFTERSLPLYICGQASSSLDIAWSLGLQGALPVWGAVQVMTQGSGRGQLRRTWISPLGNVHISVRLPQTAPFDGSTGALAVGILLCMALQEMGFMCQMKWPNDLVLQCGDGQWRKLGGILLEERHGMIVAGIGINYVASPTIQNLREGALEAISLSDPDISDVCIPDLGAFLQTLVSQIRLCYDRWIDEKTTWHKYSVLYTAFIGSCIRVEDGDAKKSLQGICLGISEEGALRLLVDGVEEQIFSGSLVRCEAQ